MHAIAKASLASDRIRKTVIGQLEAQGPIRNHARTIWGNACQAKRLVRDLWIRHEQETRRDTAWAWITIMRPEKFAGFFASHVTPQSVDFAITRNSVSAARHIFSAPPVITKTLSTVLVQECY